MSDKQMTAVDWLVEQITNGTIPAREAIQQAKAMEKEQMKALYTMYMVDTRTMELYDFDEYYNETFKND